MQYQKHPLPRTAAKSLRKNLLDSFQKVEYGFTSRQSSMLDSQQKINNYSQILQRSALQQEHFRLLETERECELQFSALRHSHFQQLQVLQKQLVKLKEESLNKDQIYSKLQQTYNKDKIFFQKESIRIKQELKDIIWKKNSQIQASQHKWANKFKIMQNQYQNKIQAFKQQNKLAYKENKNQYSQQTYRQNIKQIQEKYKEKIKQYEEKIATDEINLQQAQNKSQEKCYKLKEMIDQIVSNCSQNNQNLIKNLTNAFECQCKQLMKIIKNKNESTLFLELSYEQNKKELQQINKQSTKQFEYLAQKLKQQRKSFMQQLELTKIKIACLHQNDCKQIINLYEMKIQHLKSLLLSSQNQNQKLRRYLSQESVRRLESKRKYQSTISELNCKVMKFKMGMHAVENEYKDKLQNERSIMLMTSKSLLKDVESKNQHNKFYQEQLRKLRQLMTIKDNEVEQNQQILQQKFIMARDQQLALKAQLQRKVNQKNQEEEYFKKLLSEKDQLIIKLHQEIKKIVIPMFDNSLNQKEIYQLRDQINQKIQQIIGLKDSLNIAEEKLKETQAAMQRYQIEASINQQQAKKHYKDISDNNLSEHRIYYEERITSITHQNEEMKKMMKNQKDIIRELKKQQKQFSEKMQETITLLTGRSELEEKVMRLGLDQCLIANMTAIMQIVK